MNIKVPTIIIKPGTDADNATGCVDKCIIKPICGFVNTLSEILLIGVERLTSIFRWARGSHERRL
jgi:predicted HTH transcriptional regulator